MAIVIEEEKKTSHVWNLLGWFVFLGVIALAVYYVFFAVPPATIVPMPSNLSAIAPLAASSLSPQSLEQNPSLQALHTTIAQPSAQGPAPVGRPNPFVSP